MRILMMGIPIVVINYNGILAVGIHKNGILDDDGDGDDNMMMDSERTHVPGNHKKV